MIYKMFLLIENSKTELHNKMQKYFQQFVHLFIIKIACNLPVFFFIQLSPELTVANPLICNQLNLYFDEECEDMRPPEEISPLEFPNEVMVTPPGEQFNVTVNGGVFPLKWTTSGGVFITENKGGRTITLNTVSDFCSGSIQTKDSCGGSDTLTIYPEEPCCTEVIPLSFDLERSDKEITDVTDLTAVVTVMGGTRPVSWKVTGHRFFTNSGHTEKEATTTGNSLTVYSDNSCGTATIEADDGCSTAKFYLRSNSGVEKEIYTNFGGNLIPPSAILGPPSHTEPDDYIRRINSYQYVFSAYIGKYRVEESLRPLYNTKTATDPNSQKDCNISEAYFHQTYGTPEEVVYNDWQYVDSRTEMHLDPNKGVADLFHNVCGHLKEDWISAQPYGTYTQWCGSRGNSFSVNACVWRPVDSNGWPDDNTGNTRIYEFVCEN